MKNSRFTISLSKKLTLFPLVGVVMLCVVIGIYKIAILACVSNDSVTFMRFAHDLKTAPDQVIQSNDQHPGYPAIIIIAEWVSNVLRFEQTLEQRIIAAQSATLLCRTIAICFIFYIIEISFNTHYSNRIVSSTDNTTTVSPMIMIVHRVCIGISKVIPINIIYITITITIFSCITI